MADAVEKLSGKLGIDTTDAKTALAAANRELRVLESGFKASAAALGDWTKDATGLELRVKSLTDQIDIQKLKVDALRAEHLRLVEANGENSRAAQDAEIKLNKQTEVLNKMEGELRNTESSLDKMRSGEEEAGEAAEAMGDQVEESGSKVETFKSILGGVAGVTKGVITGVLAVGAAAITAVGMLGGLGINAANTAEKFADLATKTGIGVESLQEMNYASEILGTSLDTVTGAQARLVRSMGTAADQAGEYDKKVKDAAKSGKSIEDIELGDAAKAFEMLGVSVTDSNGKLRDNEDVFADSIDALGKMSNEAERDRVSMLLFGKSAQELNPLIKAGREEITKLREEAHEMGAVMSEEDVAAASAFKDQLDGLKLGFQGIVAQIGLAFIPGLSGIADQAKGYLGQLVGIVQGSGGDVGKMAEGIGGLLGQIVTDLASQAPQLLQAGLSLIQSLLNAIITALPTLLPAAVQIITSLIQFIVQALPTLIDAGVQILLMLVNVIIQNLPMLIEAALLAIIALANGLADALPTLIPAVVQAVITIVQTLIDNLPMLIEAALQLILGLATGLVAAIPILLPAIPQIIEALINAILDSLPMIMEVAGQLIGVLGSGIINNIPTLLNAGADLLIALGDSLAKYIGETMPKLGKSLLDGLMKGINDSADTFLAEVSEFFVGIIETAKEALGIASPSKPGIEMGRNLMLSPIIGAREELANVERYFSFAFGRLATAAANSSGSGSLQSVSNDNSFDIWGNVIIQGDTPAGSLGASLKGKRF
ncbi:MAG: hypothetical protein EHM40_18655 [Chloroflexi bacterium]|nr:MAG: hypothetical protein EHM40_18655 [Chloroflexota bacterium]